MKISEPKADFGPAGQDMALRALRYLARALAEFYAGSEAGINNYSDTCLRRVWKAVRFSWWFTSLMHKFPDAGGFGQKIQEAELDYLINSQAASTSTCRSAFQTLLYGSQF